MRKVIAKRLLESTNGAPAFYLTIEVDMDNAMQSRAAINAIPDTKVSFNDMVIKACAMALKKHPKVNSQWSDDAITINHHVNIGVAVAVEDGAKEGTVQEVFAGGDRDAAVFHAGAHMLADVVFTHDLEQVFVQLLPLCEITRPWIALAEGEGIGVVRRIDAAAGVAVDIPGAAELGRALASFAARGIRVVDAYPFKAGASTAPADHRLRLENFQCVQYSRSHTIEPRKHQAVNVSKGRSSSAMRRGAFSSSSKKPGRAVDASRVPLSG